MKKRSGIRNFKKGNAILDSASLFVIFFIVVLCVIVGKVMFNLLDDDIQADPDFSVETKAMVSQANDDYTTSFNNGFLFLFFGLWIATLISSFYLDTHPIFFAISLVLLILLLSVSTYLGNAYEDIVADAEFTTAAQEFTISHFILTNMLITWIVVGFSIMIALYARPKT